MILGTAAQCSTVFGSSVGEITGANVDSPAVFDIWNDNADWNELMGNDDISILLHLYLLDGDPATLVWQVSITVHNAPNGLGGGNFNWAPSTGVTTFTTY